MTRVFNRRGFFSNGGLIETDDCTMKRTQGRGFVETGFGRIRSAVELLAKKRWRNDSVGTAFFRVSKAIEAGLRRSKNRETFS